MAEYRTNHFHHRTKNKTFPFAVKYIVDPNFPIKSYAGSNRLYNTRNFNFYYLMDIANWTVHTNDKRFYKYVKNSCSHIIMSNNSNPNVKFRVSKLLTDILFKQKILPSRAR